MKGLKGQETIKNISNIYVEKNQISMHKQKLLGLGLPWWFSFGGSPPLTSRGHGFNPWFGRFHMPQSSTGPRVPQL